MRLGPIGEKRWEMRTTIHDESDKIGFQRDREKREKERGKELGTSVVGNNTELECGSSN